MNKNVVATMSHSEYKGVYLNDKCFRRHFMNRNQSKDHRIGTYNKISLSCFDKKIYFQNNSYDGHIFINY